MKQPLSYCVIPAAVKKKLTMAKKNRQTVYLYGPAGFGKTLVVREFLKSQRYLYINSENFEELEKLVHGAKGREQIVVLDGIHQFRNSERRQQALTLMEQSNLWILLLSRAAVPAWLLSSYVSRGMLVIGEEELALKTEEVGALAEKLGVALLQSDCEDIARRFQGNGYAIRYLFQKLLEGSALTGQLYDHVERQYDVYLEHDLTRSLEPDVLEFLLQVSVVDCFDLALAEHITGNARACAVIDRVRESGTLLQQDRDTYFLRPNALSVLRSCSRKQLGTETQRELCYNAGLYYETHDQLLPALRMYEACGNQKRIHNLLIRSARQNPTSGCYFELRKYYLALSPEEVAESPVLMSALSMLYSILLQQEQSEYWYDQLKEFASQGDTPLHREAASRVIYLDIGLPHRDVKALIPKFLELSKLLLSREIVLPEFSLTSYQPSVMNGGKDFCEWSKRDKELALLIGKPVSMLLGKYGKGLVNEALGESYFEKGTDDFAVHAYLSKAFLEAESNGKTELQFAVVGIQARMNLLNGAPGIARERLESIRKKVDEGDSPALLENMDALGCRISLYENDAAAVEKWMKQAPDEIQEFYTANRYLYMTKLRCYLRRGDYSSALSLAEQLLFYAEQYRRPYLIMETSLLKAVLYRLMDHPWEELFLKTLNMAYEFHFVRIISLEGKAVMPLLKDVKARMSDAERPKKEWFRQIYTEAERMEKLYPEYLTASLISKSDFSEHAVQILKLLDDGMTMKQISEALFLSESTVKYHTVESYRKLGAKGKLDALRKARALEII